MAEVNEYIINGYLQLLNHLSADEKLELISKLSVSVSDAKQKKTGAFRKAFGGWHSKESAEQIVKRVKQARSFKRKIERF